MAGGRTFYVVISYRFLDGEFFEEKSQFRQGKDLIQEKWSWKELKAREAAKREFSVDFANAKRQRIHRER